MNTFFEKLVRLIEGIDKGASIQETLDYIYTSFNQYVAYDRIGVALLDNNGNIYAKAARTKNEPSLKAGYCIGLNDTSLNTIVKSKHPRIVNDYNEYLQDNPDSEPTKMILEEGIKSSIAYPLITNGSCVGVIFFSSTNRHAYSEDHIMYIKLIAYHMGIVIEKNLLVDDLILASITGFAKLVEAKDQDTGGHLERMQNYSRMIAIKLAQKEKYASICNEQFIKDIYNFSPLHDIGKVGIPDNILLKPGKLTEEEFGIMKAHTTIGADVLINANNNLVRKGKCFFDMGIEITLGHHEKFNGSGYPYGLKGETIPLSARIVAVADVLDALTSKRVYKQAYKLDDSLNFIESESGRSFDPEIVEILLESKEDIIEIFENYTENKVNIKVG